MHLCLFLICFEGHEFTSIVYCHYCQVPPSKNKVDYYYNIWIYIAQKIHSNQNWNQKHCPDVGNNKR